jgi:MobA/MobL family
MPLYLLHVKPFSRERGANVTMAAAYRAGERIRDERMKRFHNHLGRDDVVYKDIILPSKFARDATVNWARDRSTLWNTVESTNRRNARLGREVLVILPPELTAAQRTQLVRRFSQELSDRYQNAVDTTIHLPRPYADERHHHAHLLLTPREITPQGLGRRITCELSGVERHARGLDPCKQGLMFVRKRWAEVTNEALSDAGLTARVDHRGFKARGINREPVPMIPQKILYMERRMGPTQAGNDIRRRHRERVEARLKGADELARVLQRQKEEGTRRVLEREKQRAASPKKAPWGSLTKEEIAQRRQEWYQANRATAIERSRIYRQKNAAAISAKKRLARLRAKAPTEQQSIERLLKWREQLRPAAAAEHSARNELAHRERDKQRDRQRGTRRKIDHTLSRKHTRNHDLSL